MKVVVFGSDRYLRKFMPLFARFYRQFWPDNPWPTLVVGQTVACEEFPTLLTGPDKTFSQQILRFLAEHDGGLFLMLLDDYFLCQPVDTNAVSKCYQAMLGNLDVVHINLTLIGSDEPSWDYDDGFLREFDKEKCQWLFQNQAGIWRPRLLRDLTRPDEDGWRMEMRGSRRARSYPGRFLTVKKSAIEYVNYMGRGGPRKVGLEWLKSQGIAPIYP